MVLARVLLTCDSVFNDLPVQENHCDENSYQENDEQREEYFRERPATEASPLAGNGLLCRWREVWPGVHRQRQGVAFCRTAAPVAGRQDCARQSGFLTTDFSWFTVECIKNGATSSTCCC